MLDKQLPAWRLYRAGFSNFSNQYFSVAKDDRSVSAAHWTRGGFWETFTMKDWNGDALVDGDVVTLQAHDGLYLSVDSGIGGRVYARSSAAGPPALPPQDRRLPGPIRPGDSIAFESPSLPPLPRRRSGRPRRPSPCARLPARRRRSVTWSRKSKPSPRDRGTVSPPSRFSLAPSLARSLRSPLYRRL